MISLDDKILKDIVNGLVYSDPELRQLYLQSILNESGEGTQNSSHQHKWDQRYNTILKIADKFDLKYWKIKRGKLWEALSIIGPENELYVFFAEKNLRKIIRNAEDSHYLRLLNLFNGHYNKMEELFEQTSLNLFASKNNESKFDIDDAREMLQLIENNPSRVIVFGFDVSFISTVRAYVFNAKNQLVWEQELTHLIDTNYQLVLENDNVNAGTKESKIEKDLKEPAKKRIVQLKK
ncbi:DUF5986 family protein [Lysinibacillus sp. NPDC093216]|uniref:DUF5986 family protein n=1 Tax=Lysinibacillus sp. NPDC093216 TaxID=3390576 RepID=UPI003D0310AB